MSDRFVTVASFSFTVEAQMAKNLLESSGIPAFLAGEMTANTLTGLFGGTHLQVREEDAQRAVALLAAASAASLEDDWESKAVEGVWTCPICGAAVRLGENTCPACGTSREAITTDRRDVRPALRRPPEADRVQKLDLVQAQAPPTTTGNSPGEAGDDPLRGPGCLLLWALLLAALSFI